MISDYNYVLNYWLNSYYGLFSGFTEAVTEAGVVKYYLRGLVSVGAKIGQVECRTNRTYTTFTNILYYDDLYYEFTQV